jgi:hypothetical protein
MNGPAAQERKHFFFEKKKQKTFIHAASTVAPQLTRK